MHELSIAASIVDAVTETVSRYPGARVKEVRLRVGALASVIEDSLQFCWASALKAHRWKGQSWWWDPARRGALRGLRQTGRACKLAELSLSHCGEPAADLRQGRELEIDSIEIDEVEEAV